MSNRDLQRIALLLPNTDTILETDLQISLPSNIIIHTARMQLDEVGKEAEKRMVDEELPRAVSALKHITNFDGAVFGCTSASAVYGEEGLSRISRELEDGLDCPATNAFSAVLSEIRYFKARRIGLLTPYTSEVNKFFTETLDRFGISCGACHGLGISDDTRIARVEPQEIMEAAKQLEHELKKQDLLLLSCTNLRAAEIRNAIGKMLELPVITSNQAIINWILSAV